MSGVLFQIPRYTPVNSSGTPYSGAKLYVYRAGTTTQAAAYTTSALSVAHANPIVANSAGQFAAVYLNPASAYNYKFVLTNSGGAQLWSEDNVPASTLTAAGIGAALYPRTSHEIGAGVTPTDYTYPPGNVRRYGAVGNGVTDDTAAINAALQAASSGSDVYFPGGHYAVNGTVELQDKVSLYGAGRAMSEIYFGASGSFQLTGASNASRIGRLSISKLGLTNQGGGPTYALQLNFVSRVLITDCIVYGTSVLISGYSYVTIENCDLFSGLIVADHPTVNEISEALKIIGCNGSNYGLDIQDTADVHISLTHLLGPLSQILVQRGEQNAAFYPPVQIANCVVDAGSDEGIRLIGVAPQISDTFVSSGRTNSKDGIYISDCLEGSLLGVRARYCGDNGLNIAFSEQIKVLGGHYNNNQGAGIRLGDSSYITIIGNTALNQASWFGGGYEQVDGITDEPSNCTNVICAYNQVEDNTSTQIYLPSATNLIHSNSPQTLSGSLLTGSATYDTASLVDGAGATTTVTVTGAALGDFVEGVSASVDLQGITVTAYVSATNTVSVRYQNETTGTIDLASHTLRVRVRKV
jgi:parallel beta-helix repeat protein